MSDRIHNLKIHPTATAEFIAGMCAGASDDTGEVCVELYSHQGELRFRFKREAIDPSMPVFLRKQAS